MKLVARNSVVLVLCLGIAIAAAAAVDSATLSTLRKQALAGEFDPVKATVEKLRPEQEIASPEWLAALSWAARAAAFAERWEDAVAYATEAYEGAAEMMKRPAGVDTSPHLATAAGAAIEVLGKAREAGGDRPGAVAYLHAQREKFRGTSIEDRIQKNYLLLSLEGKPMPELAAERKIGPRPVPKMADLRGKVTVFYFWAHWCGDCKKQRPVLFALREKYKDRGLEIIAPTKLYGYIARGEDASPEKEFQYISRDYNRDYPLPEWMPVPVSARNFADFGVSSTPTLVVVDRKGIVRLYHPGWMTAEELEPVIEKLLAQDTT